MPSTVRLAVGSRHGPFNGHTNSKHRTSRAVGGKNGVQRSVDCSNPLDAGIVGAFVRIPLNPGTPGFLNRSDGPILPSIFAKHEDGCVGSGRCKEGQHHRLSGLEINHCRILYKPVIGVQQQVWNEHSEVNFCSDGDALEDAPGENWRSDDHVVR